MAVHKEGSKEVGNCVKQPDNTGIYCERRHCLTCGWNPVVEKERKKRAKEERQE